MNRPHWYPVGNMKKQAEGIPFLPEKVDDVHIAFPANVAWLLPPVEDIPEDVSYTKGKK